VDSTTGYRATFGEEAAVAAGSFPGFSPR
jgi:hypothetical protein